MGTRMSHSASGALYPLPPSLPLCRPMHAAAAAARSCCCSCCNISCSVRLTVIRAAGLLPNTRQRPAAAENMYSHLIHAASKPKDGTHASPSLRPPSAAAAAAAVATRATACRCKSSAAVCRAGMWQGNSCPLQHPGFRYFVLLLCPAHCAAIPGVYRQRLARPLPLSARMQAQARRHCSAREETRTRMSCPNTSGAVRDSKPCRATSPST